MTESFGRGGHFFFVILKTSAIIDTISESNKNNSSYVTISTALLSKRARVSGGDLCTAEAPTEAVAEKKSALRKKRANRPPFKVRLIPTTLYHYITAIASILLLLPRGSVKDRTGSYHAYQPQQVFKRCRGASLLIDSFSIIYIGIRADFLLP